MSESFSRSRWTERRWMVIPCRSMSDSIWSMTPSVFCPRLRHIRRNSVGASSLISPKVWLHSGQVCFRSWLVIFLFSSRNIRMAQWGHLKKEHTRPVRQLLSLEIRIRRSRGAGPHPGAVAQPQNCYCVQRDMSVSLKLIRSICLLTVERCL